MATGDINAAYIVINYTTEGTHPLVPCPALPCSRPEALIVAQRVAMIEGTDTRRLVVVVSCVACVVC